MRVFPFPSGCIYKPCAELLWFLFPPVRLVFSAVPLTFTIWVTFPSQGRSHATSPFSQMSHSTLCQNSNRQAREGSVGPNHLQRLAERQINNGNYFKTNWKQKAQPSSATARQKGKPQKEEIAALSVLSTLVSSSRQILIYLSCSPKSSSKNSQFRDIFFYLS